MLSLVLMVLMVTIHGEGDGVSYLDIESPVRPSMNTSYGNIQILNEITIEFTVIYDPGNVSHTDDELHSIQNVFSLESIDSSERSSTYCSYYPSMWFTPIDNTLYVSFLNDAYCMETVATVTPNAPYSMKIHYDDSSVYIVVNNGTLMDETHKVQFHGLNHDVDTVQLWISDSLSDPAAVTLHGTHITTPITDVSTEMDPPKTIVSYVQSTKYRNTNPNTIFIIEIAVLSVFAFACFGVIIASLCLLKMRRSGRNKRDKLKAEGANSPKPKYKVVDLKQIVSNSCDSQSDGNGNMMEMVSNRSRATTARTESRIDKDVSIDGISSEYSTHSKARYYAEQIPSYASTLSDKYKNISATIPESPQLPDTPKSDAVAVMTLNPLHPKSIDAASDDGTSARQDTCHPGVDAYDLNSDEGDDVKLRRAAIQSQRAVIEAFHLDVEAEARDGATGIYDTIHGVSVSGSGSSEDMFNNTCIITSNPNVSGPESSVAGIAGSGNASTGTNVDTASNRYSMRTNVTYLTNATKRLLLPTSELEEMDCKSQRKSTTGTVSALSSAIPSNISYSEYSEYEFKGKMDDTSSLITLGSDQISSSNIVGRIKMMREKYSMGTSTETTDTTSHDAADADTDISVHMQRVSNTDRYNAVNALSLEDKQFEWIKGALRSCDENAWDRYYQNFRTHKVNESRLIRLDDVDWRELIPAIGPRNDFKNLWRMRQLSSNDVTQAVV